MIMEKVGLSVVTYVINSGSFLQSFATQQKIKSLGYDTEIINIEGVKDIIGKERKKYFLSRCLNINELKSYVVTLKGIVRKKFDRKYASQIKTRDEVFSKFYDDYFKFSPVEYGWDNVGKMCNKYKAVVVGSDQLWRPVNIAGDFYTLNFVPDDVLKISYSTSFGVSKLPKKIEEKAKAFLRRIELLSVREVSGQKMVKDLIGREIPVVCDPTMLLSAEEWESYINKERIIDEPYILCYFLGSNEEYLKFAKRLKENKKIKLVGLVHCAGYNTKVNVYMDETPFNVGPLEFINLIKYAEYVLTDSFHCCVFSILFEKSFFAFKRFSDGDEMSTNDRLTTLFNWTGIKNRLLNGNEEINEKLFSNINYAEVKERLNIKRAESIKYLEDALGGKHD